MNKNIIVTNNPMVAQSIKNDGLSILFFNEMSYFDVLYKVRDLIHIGHRLLTHPTLSSIKPNETPYKTVVLTDKKDNIDMESIDLVERAIELTNSFIDKPKRQITPKIDSDFQLIDYDLIRGAIANNM